MYPGKHTCPNNPTPEQLSDMTWEEIEPLYTALAECELPNDDATKAWLQDGTIRYQPDGSSIGGKMSRSAAIARTARRKMSPRFVSEIIPQRGKIANELTGKLPIPDTHRRARPCCVVPALIARLPRRECAITGAGVNAYNKAAGAMTVE